MVLQCPPSCNAPKTTISCQDDECTLLQVIVNARELKDDQQEGHTAADELLEHRGTL